MKRNERWGRLLRSKVAFGLFALVIGSIPVIIALVISAASGDSAKQTWELVVEMLALAGFCLVVTVATQVLQLWLRGGRQGHNNGVAG